MGTAQGEPGEVCDAKPMSARTRNLITNRKKPIGVHETLQIICSLQV